MEKCLGDTWLFIESQDDHGAGSRWDIAENKDRAKEILRNILPSGNQICDILEVKITRIYKMEPELRDINGPHGRTSALM